MDFLAVSGNAATSSLIRQAQKHKQSIYAWRSADLAAYDEFVDRVLDRGGVLGPLTRNFRSVQPILDEVERVVAPVMHREL